MNDGLKLVPDLIPETSFFKNLRSMLRPGEWDAIRQAVYIKADHKCEICGRPGRMECHEQWEYNEKTKVQKLVGLICLCSNCHEVKHIGLAEMRGRLQQAMTHMRRINAASRDEVNTAINDAWRVWRQRSQIQWKLDLSELESLKHKAMVSRILIS